MDEQVRTLQLAGHVGFDSLPDQLVSKSVQNGFVFNIMCIGTCKICVVTSGVYMFFCRRDWIGKVHVDGFPF